ncbi:hypothetical protein ES703_78871 [subsurface metagenome]
MNKKIKEILSLLYSRDRGLEIYDRLSVVMEEYRKRIKRPMVGPARSFAVQGSPSEADDSAAVAWSPGGGLAVDERDLILITYGDQFRLQGELPLATLQKFLKVYLKGVVSGVHILPFCPYSSDDGFSVIERICLVAGRATDSLDLPENLQVEKKIFAPIDYLAPEQALSLEPAEEGRKLAGKLLEGFGSKRSIWWVHNYHLGKNPIFTEALLQIIRSGFSQKMILQIHDFPECGRYQNLKLLQRILTQAPYPVHPDVHYAVLNSRDLNILLKAGIPSARVSLLENPIEINAPAEKEKAVLKAGPAAAYLRSLPSFNPQAPLIFYPVRAIRRKNVLEAALIAKLLGESVNLMVTLPGISAPERSYSDLVAKGYLSGLIKGLWRIGTELDGKDFSFEDLAGASDLVLSSSIQEGFGYLFINALQWRLPLLARDLDILAGLRDLFEEYPAHFYSRILCPLKPISRKKISKAYHRKISNLKGTLARQELHRLEADLDELLKQELLDFSYLPPALQYSLLENLESKWINAPLKEANKDLLNTARELLCAPAPDKTQDLEQRFGYGSYARSFESIAQKLLSPQPEQCSADPVDIQQQIIKQFAEIEYLRLLYD